MHKNSFRDEEDAVIRPLPRVKRILSEPSCLAHVVQLLLTFDPILVEKVIGKPHRYNVLLFSRFFLVHYHSLKFEALGIKKEACTTTFF